MTLELREHILSNYSPNFAEAMLKPEIVEQIEDFLDRNGSFQISYTQAYFSNCKIDVYELDGEQRLFSDALLTLCPISEEYAKGDWLTWIKKANKINGLR